MMRLRILTPTELVLDEPVTRLVAEAEDGAFGLLPKHVDIVADLRAGVLSYRRADDVERFVGLDEGTLVKLGENVSISTRAAIPGDDLATLRVRVDAEFSALDEHDRSARAALARLEIGLIRRFVDLESVGQGL